jgi:protoporphyrinogen oxidase
MLDYSRSVTILGAGLTGLTVGYILAKRGTPVQVFESEDQAGGMAITLQRGKFRFDLGPHRFYTQNQDVISLVMELLGGELLEHKRISTIRLRGRKLEYPPNVANLVRSTELADSLNYLLGYLKANWRLGDHKKEPADFENWVVSRFGRPLYELYFEPYTQKVWGRPPLELSAELARRRISVPNLSDVLIRLMISSRDHPGPYVTRFWYPEHGIGRIAKRMAEAICLHGGEVHLKQRVDALHLEANRVVGLTTKDGNACHDFPTNLVFSTIPLPCLIQAMDPSQEELVQEAKQLQFRALILVYMYLARPMLGNDHWIYFPERQYIFNRVSEPRTFSPGHTPAGQTSLCAEITCSIGDDTWNLTPDQLTAIVVSQLEGCGMLHSGEVIGSFTHRLRFGYPVYTLGYKKRLDALLAFTRSIENLMTGGRQGSFNYGNMSDAIASGIQTAHLLQANHPELSFDI